MRIKKGSIEILGYIGLTIWSAAIFYRMWSGPTTDLDILLVGIAPNIGAAWLTTMIGKWIVLFAMKRDITMKKHFLICSGVLVAALISEIIHHLFLNSPFDRLDIMATIIAQVIIFALPLIIKDNYFNNYDQAPREIAKAKRFAFYLLSLLVGLVVFLLALFVFQKPNGFLGLLLASSCLYLIIANTIRLCRMSEKFRHVVWCILDWGWFLP